MRKILIIFAALFIIIGQLFMQPAWALPQITGKSAVLMDLHSGQVLYEKSKDEKLPPASITKVMTAILAIESGKLDKVVTISEKPPLVEGTKVYLEEGEKVKLRDLLYASLVHSANDAALAIAEYLAGDEATFAKKMNEKAKELGAYNTNFINPHGLTADGHYTTAYDLAIISKYAMKNDVFRQVVQAKVYDWQGQAWQTRLINKNELLWSYDGANGIKTGYTKEARNTIVATAVRDDRAYLVVVLGSSSSALWTDASALLDFGFKNYYSLELANPEKTAALFTIDEKRQLELVPEELFNISVAKNTNQKVEPMLDIQPLDDKINKGEKVGKMFFYVDGELVGQVGLIAKNTVKSPFNILGFILNIGAGLFFLQVLWRIYIRYLRRRRRVKRSNYGLRDYSYRGF